MAKPIKTLELHYPITQFWIQCSTKFMRVQIFAIFPSIRKKKVPQIKIERVETRENWSASRGRPVQLKVAVAFSKIHARRKWNETFEMIFLFLIKHCCPVFSFAGSNDFWRFGLGLATFTQYRTAFRADTKKKATAQNRTEQNNNRTAAQKPGFSTRAGGRRTEFAAYFSLEITPI